MTTRRRHTTRLMAAGLALGLLASSLGTAHAQTSGATPHRYQARIAGASVRFQKRSDDGAGLTGYEYEVTFTDAAAFYYVEDGLGSRADALVFNERMFRAARDTFPGATSAHKNGVWLVQATKDGFCHVATGTLWRRVSFMALAVDRQCAAALHALRATFGGVSAAIGRHSPAGIPFPAAAMAPRTPSHSPVPTATPVPAPTATPAPQPQDLVHLSGDQNTQSDTFTADGTFTISWSTSLEDDSLGSGYFGLTLYSANGDYLDLVANTTSAGQNTFTEHADCSGGCYFKVSTDNMSYDIIAD